MSSPFPSARGPRRSTGFRPPYERPVDQEPEITLIGCPDPGCGAPAELFDRVTLGSTHGAVAHVRTRCLNRHHFFLPLDRITSVQA
jgi:hypothetical protein